MKELAAKEGRTAGSVIASLAHQGFHATTVTPAAHGHAKPRLRNGIAMVPKRSQPVTVAHVQKLMDEEGG